MIKDKNISWKTKVVNRDFRTMYGCLNGTFEATGGAVAAAHSVGASEQTIVQVGAAADQFYDMFLIPWDMDISHPLRWRLLFTHSSTSADVPVFTFGFMGLAAGEAMAEITSHADTVLTHTVSTTEDALEVSDWKSTGSQSYIASTDSLIITRLAATSLGSASANEIELIALQLEYTIRATATDGNRHTTSQEPVS